MAHSTPEADAARPYAPLILQRLLREQAKRGGAQLPADVLAADLGLPLKTVLRNLDDLLFAGVVERHRSHSEDSEELPVLSVPLAGETYKIDVGELDPVQTRLLQQLELEGQGLTTLGRRQDLAAVAPRVLALRSERGDAVLAEAIERLARTNLTGTTVLAGDLLDTLAEALRAPPSASSSTARHVLEHRPPPDSSTTSRGNVGTVGTVDPYAFGVMEIDPRYGEPSSAPADAEGKAVNDEETIEAALPRTTEAILEALDYSALPAALEDELVQLLRTREAMNEGEELSARQLGIADDFVAGRMRRLVTLPDEKRQRFPIVRAAIQRATHDDELHAALKAAQPWREPAREPEPDPLDEVLRVAAREAADV